MKQYVVDELRPDDYQVLKHHLDAQYAVPEFDGLYQVPLDDLMLSQVQRTHADCQPFYFALELLPDRLACELLVRTNNRVRCDCIQTANASQRNWLIETIDAIFDRLGITT